MLDAHQHFWQYQPERDAWITENMSVLRRNFMPEDLQPLLAAHQIKGCIAVQADQSATETHFLLQLAAQNDIIEGVVGWTDLCAPDMEARLSAWRNFSKLRGFRHILQGESPDYMLQPAFIRGLKALHKYGFTYDILLYPSHLAACRVLLHQLDEQPLILDHLAKPYIRKGDIETWAKDLRALARHPNLYCKISGMVTEADWHNWQYEDFIPYLDTVMECFGVERVVYGSDWPVCLLAADYTAQYQVVRRYLEEFSPSERAMIMGGNGRNFYGIGANRVDTYAHQ